MSNKQLTQLIYPDQNELNYGHYRWHIATSAVTDCKQRVCLWFVPLLSFPTNLCSLLCLLLNATLNWQKFNKFPQPVEKKVWVTYQVRKNVNPSVHFEIKFQIFSVYTLICLNAILFSIGEKGMHLFEWKTLSVTPIFLVQLFKCVILPQAIQENKACYATVSRQPSDSVGRQMLFNNTPL